MPFLVVDNSGFTGRVILNGNWAVRFRGALVDPDGAPMSGDEVLHDKTDFPNAVFELANAGAWAGKRGSDPNSIIELGGVAGVAGSRLQAAIAGDGDPLADVTYQIGGASQNAEFFGNIIDSSATDNVSVVKVGNNTQALSGANTYSGTTTVNGGSLLVNGTHQMDATLAVPVGDYTVNAGGALGGSGTIGAASDPVNVTVAGGTLAPGAGAGTLTLNGNYVQNTGSELAIEIGGSAAGAFDVLAVNGTANIAGTLDIDLINGFTPANGNSFTVLTATSVTGNLTLAGESSGFALQVNPTSLVLNFSAATVAGDYNNNGVVDAADYVLWRNGGPLQNEGATPGNVTVEDYDFWRSRFGATSGTGSGITAAVQAVPEPAALALLLLGVALVGIGRRGC
jgi:autotransporter-associated beta strand protein